MRRLRAADGPEYDDERRGPGPGLERPGPAVRLHGSNVRLQSGQKSFHEKQGESTDGESPFGGGSGRRCHPNLGRRDFGRLAITGTLGAAALLGSRTRPRPRDSRTSPASSCARSLRPSPPTTNCCSCKQIGAEYVSVGSTPDLRTAAGFSRSRSATRMPGITVWNIGNTDVHNMPEVTLNLPGRDQKIEEYKQYLRNLGQGRHPLHDLRPHGQRHLEQRPGRSAALRPASST